MDFIVVPLSNLSILNLITSDLSATEEFLLMPLSYAHRRENQNDKAGGSQNVQEDMNKLMQFCHTNVNDI